MHLYIRKIQEPSKWTQDPAVVHDEAEFDLLQSTFKE